MMSILEPTPNTDISERDKLRLELKGWEKLFAAANQGRKAGRDDIKQHPEIGNPPLLKTLLSDSTN